MAEKKAKSIEVLVFTAATTIMVRDHRIPDDYFKQQLRVWRATLNELLNMVNPQVARQDTSMRNCIPLEKILAIGLYRLAHGS